MIELYCGMLGCALLITIVHIHVVLILLLGVNNCNLYLVGDYGVSAETDNSCITLLIFTFYTGECKAATLVSFSIMASSIFVSVGKAVQKNKKVILKVTEV